MAIAFTPGTGGSIKSTTDGSDEVPHHKAEQSGTWTVDLGATDNAVLDAIAASLAGSLTVGSHAVTNAGTFAVQAVCTNAGTFATQSICTNAGTFAVQATQAGTWNITNISGTISLPTGAATAANQATIISSAASIDSKITACNTGAVVLAAGTAAFGKLAANSGVDIGDVDVTSLPALPAGSNNIGDVDVLTLPALAAGTNLIGSVAAAGATSTIYDGVTPLTVKYAPIGCASSGDNTIVAGVTSKKIRVISLFLAATGTAVDIYFRENTAGTAIGFTATYPLTLDPTGATGPSGLSLPSSPTGHFESSAGNPLVLNLSAAQGVGGWLSYVEA